MSASVKPLTLTGLKPPSRTSTLPLWKSVAHAAVVLAEADVQDPMQSVLHGPVPPDGHGQRLRRERRAGQVVPDLGRDLAAAGDAADGLDRQYRPQARPVLEGGEGVEVREGEHPPADQAAVAAVERVEEGAERSA